MLQESVSDRAHIARAHYDRAKVYVEQGDVSAAVFAYEAAIDHAPGFAQAHSNLGTLYLHSGRRVDALHAFEAAIRAKPDLAPLYCNLAAALIALGRCDEAIAALAGCGKTPSSDPSPPVAPKISLLFG
jgi:predicted Zn-dependent protease